MGAGFYIFPMRFLSRLAFLVLLAACGGRELSVHQFARYNAKRLLLEEVWHGRPDSLQPYLAGLYKQEKISPEQVAAFMKKVDRKPELWIRAQELTLKELERLKPKP